MEILREDAAAISAANSYEALAEVALESLRQSQEQTGERPVMVCGPIGSGGAFLRRDYDPAKARERNLAEMRGVIRFLEKEHAIFNQLPYLDRAEEIGIGMTFRGGQEGSSFRDFMFSLLSPSRDKRESISDRDLLREKFHLRVLTSGRIGLIYFLSGWKNSVGSRWYHEQALRLGIPIKYVVPKFTAATK